MVGNFRHRLARSICIYFIFFKELGASCPSLRGMRTRGDYTSEKGLRKAGKSRTLVSFKMKHPPHPTLIHWIASGNIE